MRPLSEFLAERAAVNERLGLPPITDERRKEIREAMIANIGVPPSPEAFAAVEAGWPETLAAMKREGYVD